jgi:hypothetical protein
MTFSRERNPVTPHGGLVPIPGGIGNLGVRLNVGDIGGLLGDRKHTLIHNPTTDINTLRRATAP